MSMRCCIYIFRRVPPICSRKEAISLSTSKHSLYVADICCESSWSVLTEAACEVSSIVVAAELLLIFEALLTIPKKLTGTPKYIKLAVFHLTG